MEMMTLAAVALGASGLATTGIVGLAATVAIMPMVALAATAVVWSAAYGVRKLRHLIGRNQKAIDSGVRQETRLDRILKGIDKKIEPTLGLIGKLALMSIGGQILVELALPLVELIPHVSMVTPAIHSAIHAFESLPGLAQLAVCAPIGYSIGRFAYNPLLAPAASAVKRAAGKVFGSLRFPFKRNQKAPVPEGIKTTTPGPKNDGASGKILKKAPDAKSALNEAAEKQQKSDTLPLPNRLRQNRKNPQNPQK